MSLGQAITQFFETPGGTAIVALFLLAALKFVVGTLAAIRDDVFTADAIGAWLRKDVAGRVLPVFAVMVTAHLAGGLSIGGGEDIITPGNALTILGLGMAATYVTGALASIRESLEPKPGTRSVPED